MLPAVEAGSMEFVSNSGALRMVEIAAWVLVIQSAAAITVVPGSYASKQNCIAAIEAAVVVLGNESGPRRAIAATTGNQRFFCIPVQIPNS
jgi:hypothetical protein